MIVLLAPRINSPVSPVRLQPQPPVDGRVGAIAFSHSGWTAVRMTPSLAFGLPVTGSQTEINHNSSAPRIADVSRNGFSIRRVLSILRQMNIKFQLPTWPQDMRSKIVEKFILHSSYILHDGVLCSYSRPVASSISHKIDHRAHPLFIPLNHLEGL